MNDQIDFIPQEHVDAERTQKRLVRAVLASVCSLLVVLTVASSAHFRLNRAEAQVVPLRERAADMSAWEDEVSDLLQGLNETRQRHEAMSQLVRGNSWFDFLEDMAGATNEYMWLTDCRLDRADSGEGGATGRLALSGVAASDIEIIEFMRTLSSSDHVVDLRLETSRRTEVSVGRGLIEFAIVGTLN